MLGEAFTPEDEEDSAAATVSGVWAYQARYRVPLARAVAGNWVLLEGLDATSECGWAVGGGRVGGGGWAVLVHCSGVCVCALWGNTRSALAGAVCFPLHPPCASPPRAP